MWRRYFLLLDVVCRLSFNRKSSGHFTTGNDFSAVSGRQLQGPREPRGWRSKPHKATRCWTSRCSTAALFRSMQASPSVSPPAGTCGRGQREKKQPTHHPRVNRCRRRSLAGKTAVGDVGLDAVPGGTMRWTVRNLADDSASEVSQWTPSRPVVVVVVVVGRRRRRSPPEAASRVAMVGDSFSVVVM